MVRQEKQIKEKILNLSKTNFEGSKGASVRAQIRALHWVLGEKWGDNT
jgi:hypothetical protein